MNPAKERRVKQDRQAEEKEEGSIFDAVLEAIDSTEADPDRNISVQIDQSLRDAVKAAAASNQKASVTLVIGLQPGAERRMSFSAKLTAKLPRPPVSAATLYADAEGGVHHSDPAQLRMAFSAPTPVKEN